MESAANPMSMEPRQEVFDANDNAAFWVVALTVSFVGYVLLLPLLLFLQQSSTNSSKCEEEAFVGTTNSSDSSSNCNSSSANTASEIRTKEEASHSTSTTAAQPGTQYADADLDLEMHLREGKEDDGAASSSCVQTCNFWQRMLQSCRPRRNASSRWYKHKESIHNLILKIAIKQEGEQMEKREEKTLLLDNAEKKDTIFTWDYETRQTTKIILHSTIAPFLEGGMNIVLLIILGIWVGTNNLTVYLLVNRFIGFTTEALYGTLQRTLYKLTTDLKSNSTNINNHDETGQFAQITFILILALSIPMWILWVLCIEPFLQWLGMNDDVVSMGADYTILFMLMSLIQAINDCLYYMIAKRNPTGSYVTYCLLLEKTLMVLILTTWIASAEDVDLITVGLIQLEVVIAFLVINVAVTTCKGWLKTYQKGLMGGWAIADGKALKAVYETALPIAVGNVLIGVEWEILALLAGTLGPTEATAWCLFASLLESVLQWFDGISFAATLRDEILRKSNGLDKTAQSAIQYFMALVCLSLPVAVLIGTMGDRIVVWFTEDVVIQQIVSHLCPLLGIGIPTIALMKLGWAFLCSRGQHGFASAISLCVSWCIVIPTSVTLTDAFDIDLQGQATVLIIGNTLVGTIYLYSFLTFDSTSHQIVDKELIHDSTTNETGEVDKGKHSQDTEETSVPDNAELRLLGLSASNPEERKIYRFGKSRTGTSSNGSSKSENTTHYSESIVSSRVSNLQSQSECTDFESATTEDTSMGWYMKEAAPCSLTKHLQSIRSHSSSESGSSSCDSTVSKLILEYRDQEELGTLTKEDIELLQVELYRILTALRATIKYDLEKSKKRVLEELQWVLYVSPDIFESHHLEEVIHFLYQDNECREALWPAIKYYLPDPLVRIGLDRLLNNDYLKAVHLKALMDKFVMDIKFEGNALEGEEEEEEEQGFERALCHATSSPIESSAFCFVMRE